MFTLILYFLFLLSPGAGEPAAVSHMPGNADIHELYQTLNLSDKGLSETVFQFALKGHHKLQQEGKLNNPQILTIADLSQSSRNKRFYVIDLLNKKLLFNTFVAHGRNTGEEFARHFSNTVGSLQSSLGFYVTREVIKGASVGLSLVLEGLERGFNDNAVNREIIMHGAAYATEDFIKRTGRLGRSFGCPALPPDQIRPVVETIREGSCLFVYSSNDHYLHRSGLLNK